MVFLIFSGFQIMNGQANEGTIITTERPDLILLDKLRLEHNMKAREEVSYESIDGDPFLYKDFTPGKLLLKAGESIPLYLRYDIYKDEIQFRQQNDTFALTNAESVSFIMMDTITFLRTAYLKSARNEKSAETSWFILKSDGRCRLLIKKNLRLQAAVLPKPYQEPKPAKFIHTSDSYYLEPENQMAVRVTSKKDILGILSVKSSDLSRFIDSNHLNVRDIKDLVTIVAYFNQQ